MRVNPEMNETAETLIGKDDATIRLYANSAGSPLIEELFAELWGTIRAANFCGGQPRSKASIDSVMLARLAVRIADYSDDEHLKAEAWSIRGWLRVRVQRLATATRIP